MATADPSGAAPTHFLTPPRRTARTGAALAVTILVAAAAMLTACNPPKTAADLVGSWRRTHDGTLLTLSEGLARYNSNTDYMPILEKGPFAFDGSADMLDVTLGITTYRCRVRFFDKYAIQLGDYGPTHCPSLLAGNWTFEASEFRLSLDRFLTSAVSTAQTAAVMAGSAAALYTAARLLAWRLGY